MEEAIKQIGMRLVGLRDALELTPEEVAETCGLSVDRYLSIERGEADITISNIMKIARHYGVSADALMFAEEPKMRSYYVVRNGQGLSVERTKAYKYNSLTSGFQNRLADAFIVTIEPKGSDAKMYKNSHDGQEFNYVLEGRMELFIDGKTIFLEQGDSIYFDATKPHGMLAADGRTLKILAIAIE